MRTIIVLGGAGFIGREFCRQAIHSGYKVQLLDKDYVTAAELITKLNSKYLIFNQLDLSDKVQVTEWIHNTNANLSGDEVTAVVNFAAFKYLPASIRMAYQYYDNNINVLLSGLRIAKELNAKNFIFSSSAGVYSQSDGDKEGEVTAYYEHQISNLRGEVTPYGQSKRMGEFIVKDVCDSIGMNWYSLRYFNPIGRTEVSEDNTDSLFGTIRRCINSGSLLTIYGGDYDSPDGTCIRDYIDLRDLVSAHLFLCNHNDLISGAYNVGTGKPTSVLEVAKVVKIVIPEFEYNIGPRRVGDDVGGYAKVTLNDYGWKCYYSLEDSIASLI